MPAGGRVSGVFGRAAIRVTAPLQPRELARGSLYSLYGVILFRAHPFIRVTTDHGCPFQRPDACPRSTLTFRARANLRSISSVGSPVIRSTISFFARKLGGVRRAFPSRFRARPFPGESSYRAPGRRQMILPAYSLSAGIDSVPVTMHVPRFVSIGSPGWGWCRRCGLETDPIGGYCSAERMA